MRKALIALGVVVAALVAAIVLIPLLFEDRLVAAVQGQLSQSLDADVQVGGFDLTLLSSFPDLTVELEDLQIDNHAPFAGTTLAKVDRASVTVGLKSALSGGPYEVRELALEHPVITILTDEQGRSNLDLGGAQPEAAPEAPAEPSSPMALRLDRTAITDGDLVLDDRSSNLHVEIRDLDHEGRGRLDGDLVSFQTTTDMGQLSLRSHGVGLLNQVKLGSKLDLDYDMGTGGVKLGDNELRLNALPLKFSGSATPKGADWDLDLSFAALHTTLKELLSLVPSIYKQDMETMQIDGGFALDGAIKGLLRAEGDDLPALALNVKLDHGRFREPDLPVGIDGIDLDLAVEHPGGPLDAMVVDLRDFALKVGSSPLSGHLKVTSPISDPDLDLVAKGTLDLGQLTAAFPIEGTKLAGKATVDMAVKGRVSALQAGDLQSASASGNIQASGLSYQAEGDPTVYVFQSLNADLSPRSLQLHEARLNVGDADMAISGDLDNVYAYALGTGPLQGAITLRSKNLDLTPFAGDDEPAPKGGKAQAPAEAGVATVPTDLDLSVDIAADRLKYPPYNLDDVKGVVKMKDGRVDLNGLSFGFLDGRVGMSGSYDAPTTQKADVAFTVDLKDFGLGGLVDAIDTLQKLAPVAKGAKGRLNTSFTLKTTLKGDMTPDLSTLYSKGKLRMLGVELAPGVLEKLSGMLKDDKFKTLNLSNTDMGFEILEGKVQVDRTALLLGGVAAALFGTTGVLDQKLDLKIDTQLPLDKLQGAGLGRSLGLDKVSAKGPVNLRVLIGGTFDKPTLNLKSDLMQDLTGQATELVQDKVDEVVNDALAKAQAAGDKLVADAQKAADQLKAQADLAGDKLVDEADKQADKLLKDAKGNAVKEAAAKEAGKKLRQQAKDKAAKLSKEADKQGDALVSKAETQRDALIAEAKKKAGN